MSEMETKFDDPAHDDSYYQGLEEEDDDEDEVLAMWLPKTPLFVPRTYEISLPDGQTRTFQLDFKQRIYLLLDSPNSW